MASFNGLSSYEHDDEHDELNEHDEHNEHDEQNNLSLDIMSTGGPLAWVLRRAGDPRYSGDPELRKLKEDYKARHSTFNPVVAKTAQWKSEGKNCWAG